MHNDHNVITNKRLAGLLNYDPLTGVFTWAVTRGFIKRGKIAGGLFQGRPCITIDGKRYLASRLAWQYVKGRAPAKTVRYLNGDSTDVRMANLTLQKTKGAAVFARVDVGIKAVYQGYRVISFVGGQAIDLGDYPDFETAMTVLKMTVYVQN